jgi:hypothetical protein
LSFRVFDQSCLFIDAIKNRAEKQLSGKAWQVPPGALFLNGVWKKRKTFCEPLQGYRFVLQQNGNVTFAEGGSLNRRQKQLS